MFWVISTAFVLQGVIISRRGPTKCPFRLSSLSGVASPKSQQSLSMSAWESTWSHSTAITLLDGVLKKRIILIFTIYDFTIKATLLGCKDIQNQRGGERNGNKKAHTVLLACAFVLISIVLFDLLGDKMIVPIVFRFGYPRVKILKRLADIIVFQWETEFTGDLHCPAEVTFSSEWGAW